MPGSGSNLRISGIRALRAVRILGWIARAGSSECQQRCGSLKPVQVSWTESDFETPLSTWLCPPSLGFYGCVLGFGGVYHGMLVSEILILGAHLGWQDRLWARWTPLDGQERDDLNPGDPPLRIRCRSASIGL